MKNFIIGIAMVFIYIFILTTSFDSKMLLEKIDETKFITQEVSATGTLFIDYEDFSEGSITFKSEEGIKAIDGQIKEFMKLDEANNPLSDSYWQETINYRVYFYDDSGICKIYDNNTLVDSFSFEYPYLHEDDFQYKKTITDPTVVVTIDAGKPRFRIKSFQENLTDNRIVKTSSHVWDEYK